MELIIVNGIVNTVNNYNVYPRIILAAFFGISKNKFKRNKTSTTIIPFATN